MRFKKYTKEQLINAIKASISYREALIKLNVAPYGGNYWTIKKYTKELDLDTSHFCGKSWAKGRKFPNRVAIEDYLSNKFPIQSFKLKKKLIAEKLIKSICSSCKLTKWIGKPIPLELHHKDGNNLNNNLSNLELLCPNCHSMTDNYRGKNKETYKNKCP